jgi:hypothetical protein
LYSRRDLNPYERNVHRIFKQSSFCLDYLLTMLLKSLGCWYIVSTHL